MVGMADFNAAQFRTLLEECRELYVSSGDLCATECPDLLPKGGDHFRQLMEDLHRALLLKVFITICEADRRWSMNERLLAVEMVEHLWGQRLDGDRLKQVVQQMSAKALSLKWYSLVRPFDQIAALRNRVGQLETIVTRLANLIARIDGPPAATELACVKMIQDELYLHLRQIPIDEPDQHEQASVAQKQTIDSMYQEAARLPAAGGHSATQTQATADDDKQLEASELKRDEPESVPQKSAEELLDEALADLDRLIGLGNIKQEVRTLANYLKVQGHRESAGLPTTPLSLHMVFHGNPGTGKTTIARVLGKVFGAMGILEKGHLIETDRSGLVAGYAGQTSLKSEEKINEALDGVLFVDEAYSLISSESDDPYGQEAIQVLLKRMEDERDRLVVILAGYPVEMRQLLGSNPGLSSRFSRNLDFEDYSALELAEIFGQMCDKNHYELPPEARAKVIVGFHDLHKDRDEHFGNGRTVRNIFELAIRHMANRIVRIADLSVEQLTTLEAGDIEFEHLSANAKEQLSNGDALQFYLRCPACEHGKSAPQKFLGQRVRCPKCKKNFDANWGELVS